MHHKIQMIFKCGSGCGLFIFDYLNLIIILLTTHSILKYSIPVRPLKGLGVLAQLFNNVLTNCMSKQSEEQIVRVCRHENDFICLLNSNKFIHVTSSSFRK